MIDMIGAIAGTAVYAVLVGVLVGCAPVRGPTKLAAFAAAAVWGAVIVAVAALGGFAPGAAGPSLLPRSLSPRSARSCSEAGTLCRDSGARFSPCRCRLLSG